jgi:hypothetical protein
MDFMTDFLLITIAHIVIYIVCRLKMEVLIHARYLRHGEDKEKSRKAKKRMVLIIVGIFYVYLLFLIIYKHFNPSYVEFSQQAFPWLPKLPWED